MREAQKASMLICDEFWKNVALLFEVWGQGRVVISGDSLPTHENVFVLMNHRWYADWMALFCVASRKGRLGAIKLFAKGSLKYLFPFGQGMQLIGWPLLSRTWADDVEKINKTFHNLKTRKLPFWLASHIEGTRHVPEKVRQSQEYAKKHDLPVLTNVLLPRKKGFVATVQGLRDAMDAVYDFTIVWEDGKEEPSLNKVVFRKGMRLNIHVRRFPIRDIPTDEDEMYKWLLDRWVEKDQLVQHLLEHGNFPNVLKEPWNHLDMNLK